MKSNIYNNLTKWKIYDFDQFFHFMIWFGCSNENKIKFTYLLLLLLLKLKEHENGVVITYKFSIHHYVYV